MVSQPKGTQPKGTQPKVAQDERDPWELEVGLPNDVDAYMANCRFGTRDEYMEAVIVSGAEGAGLMFLADLIDAGGEVLGQQGWSVGSGWTPDVDGQSISHATRKNVVNSSRYGQLQYRVVKELEVDMNKYGKPVLAASWNGLGFHWMLQEHETLKMVEGVRQTKLGLMPTAFLGVKEDLRSGQPIAAGQPAAKTPAIGSALEKRLRDLAQTSTLKEFQIGAMKIAGVAQDDDLLASIMDGGPTGYFAQHQK